MREYGFSLDRIFTYKDRTVIYFRIKNCFQIRRVNFYTVNLSKPTEKKRYNLIQIACFKKFIFQSLCFKVQSCKLSNNKYMIVSIQTTNTEIFTFIAALVFKLLSRKVLFINRKKTIETVKK